MAAEKGVVMVAMDDEPVACVPVKAEGSQRALHMVPLNIRPGKEEILLPSRDFSLGSAALQYV